MDHDELCVRPTDTLIQQDISTSSSPSPLITNAKLDDSVPHSNTDEKLLRYDSSPGSTVSYSDETTFSPIQDESTISCSSSSSTDDDLVPRMDIFEVLRHHMSPGADQLHSPIRPPFTLDEFEQSLIVTYLTEYPQSTFDLSPCLRPHPMAVTTSIAMHNPASLHLILSRSALFRLTSGQSESSQETNQLEVTLMTHKGKALELVRNFSPQEDSLDSFLISIVALGILDHNMDMEDSASIHYKVAREVCRSMGGPWKIHSPMISRGLAHFECCMTTTTQSFIWDQKDFGFLHGELNAFFGHVWSAWNTFASARSSAGSKLSKKLAARRSQRSCHPYVLKQDSVLRDGLCKKLPDRCSSTPQDRSEMVFQITCLLIMCAFVVDNQTNKKSLREYIDSTHDIVDVSDVTGRTCNNIMWILQFCDHSNVHSRRIWNVAGWIWVVKHVNYNVQCTVKDWLILFLTGNSPVKSLKLDSFAFSYAS